MAKVSVIVPVYKTEKQLQRCVQSVLNQTMTDVEIILVDDCSPDRCPELCEEIAEQDSRISVIHHLENRGLSEARNTGVQASKGEYIMFLDSDDYWSDDRDFLKNALLKLENTQTDILAFLFLSRDKNGNDSTYGQELPQIFKDSAIINTQSFAHLMYMGPYCNGLAIAVWNKIYRREFIQEVDYRMRAFEDEDWTARVMCQEGTVCCFGYFGYIYAESPDRVSITHEEFSCKRFGVLDCLQNRIQLFRDDPFMIRESIRLYLNLYIEYYFNAKAANISAYGHRKDYFRLLRQGMRMLSIKDIIRFGIFYISPKAYQWIILERR